MEADGLQQHKNHTGVQSFQRRCGYNAQITIFPFLTTTLFKPSNLSQGQYSFWTDVTLQISATATSDGSRGQLATHKISVEHLLALCEIVKFYHFKQCT